MKYLQQLVAVNDQIKEVTFISAVFALKSLQKSMILRPAWPNAGPTGGEGLACPAFMTSFIVDDIAFPDIWPWMSPKRVRQGESGVQDVT